MSIFWGVHVHAHLLDNIRNVGLGESKVLKNPNKATICGGIIDKIACVTA